VPRLSSRSSSVRCAGWAAAGGAAQSITTPAAAIVVRYRIATSPAMDGPYHPAERRSLSPGGRSTPPLTNRIGPHTFEAMKDAIVTVRIPSALRRRISALAAKEGRSLSAQVERLVEAGLEGAAARRGPIHALSGIHADARVPTLSDFRRVREELSRSLRR
jgi:hypothetical protein